MKTTRRRSGLRFVVVVAAGVVAVAVTAVSAFALVNGAPDNGRHPYVGMVAFLYQGADTAGNPVVKAELCSGSLVAATVFVTAAHCVPPPALQVATRITFVDSGAYDPVSGNDALHNGPYAVGSAVSVDPDFCFECADGLVGLDTHDLAVVSIARKSITKYPGYPTSYAQLPSLGQTDTLADNSAVEIVGYGLPALGSRQVASATIIPGGGSTGDQFLKLSSNPAQGGGATCRGDSGGPDLLPGTNTILAISGYGANLTCNAVEYSQRLDSPDALAFITGFLH